MPKIKPMEAVVRVLEDEGVSVAFGVPGAAILPLYDALRGSSMGEFFKQVSGIDPLTIEQTMMMQHGRPKAADGGDVLVGFSAQLQVNEVLLRILMECSRAGACEPVGADHVGLAGHLAVAAAHKSPRFNPRASVAARSDADAGPAPAYRPRAPPVPASAHR